MQLKVASKEQSNQPTLDYQLLTHVQPLQSPLDQPRQRGGQVAGTAGAAGSYPFNISQASLMQLSLDQLTKNYINIIGHLSESSGEINHRLADRCCIYINPLFLL